MADTPHSALIGNNVIGGLILGSGPDVAAAPPTDSTGSTVATASLSGTATVIGTVGGTAVSVAVSGAAEAVSVVNVRVTQEAVEVVFDPGTANVRITQEVIEVVAVPGTAGDTEASAAQSGAALIVPGVSGDTAASAQQNGFAYLPGVRVTQEVIEAVVDAGAAGLANVRVTQEAIEAVFDPGTAKVRVTQEILEVVQEGQPENEASWNVYTRPVVRWIATVPKLDEWTVRGAPRVFWDALVEDPGSNWIVKPKPQAIWKTGPGVANGDCISAEGDPPAPEPPLGPIGLSNIAY